MEVLIPPWLVMAALWVSAGAVALILLLIVGVRATRTSATRRGAGRLAPLSEDLLAVACDEDPGGDAATRLRNVPRRHRRTLERAIVARLEFLRGRAAHDLTAILESWGVHRQWVRRCRALSSRRRAMAVSNLGLLGNPALADVLRSRLSDRHREVRSSAAWALGQVRNSDSAALVLAAVSPGPRSGLPLWVAVGAVAFPDAGQSISTALTHPDAPVRAAAARAVALGGWLHAAPTLRAAMVDEDDDAALIEQVGALAVVGSDHDYPSLMMATTPENTAGVRVAAVTALAELGGDLEPFVRLLRDPNPDVARCAARALAGSGVSGRRALAAEPDPSAAVAQERALVALFAPADRRALPAGPT